MIKDVTRKNSKRYYTTASVLESITLLSFTSFDIAEIAERLNFQEPTHFTRFFKKHGGITPNKFRQTL
jgi:AraC-like DNA-binding protein